jgi:hypothetical protein
LPLQIFLCLDHLLELLHEELIPLGPYFPKGSDILVHLQLARLLLSHFFHVSPIPNIQLSNLLGGLRKGRLHILHLLLYSLHFSSISLLGNHNRLAQCIKLPSEMLEAIPHILQLIFQSLHFMAQISNHSLQCTQLDPLSLKSLAELFDLLEDSFGLFPVFQGHIVCLQTCSHQLVMPNQQLVCTVFGLLHSTLQGPKYFLMLQNPSIMGLNCSQKLILLRGT